MMRATGRTKCASPSARKNRRWRLGTEATPDRKSTRLNSSHANISYAVFCLKKKKNRYMSMNQIDEAKKDYIDVLSSFRKRSQVHRRTPKMPTSNIAVAYCEYSSGTKLSYVA